MYSYTFNEYVVPNFMLKTRNGDQWTVEYEPLDSTPVIQGSLAGTLHNNSAPASAFICLRDGGDWKLNELTGVITAVFDDEPHSEHYLYVNYEAGNNHQKINWLQEGF